MRDCKIYATVRLSAKPVCESTLSNLLCSMSLQAATPFLVDSHSKGSSVSTRSTTVSAVCCCLHLLPVNPSLAELPPCPDFDARRETRHDQVPRLHTVKEAVRLVSLPLSGHSRASREALYSWLCISNLVLCIVQLAASRTRRQASPGLAICNASSTRRPCWPTLP